jgi:hypothetical protein
VSFCRDQGELTDNRPPRQAVYHWVSWSWTLASFAPEFGAAVALRPQGDGARGVLDVDVSLPIPEGAVDLYLLLDQYAPFGRLLIEA